MADDGWRAARKLNAQIQLDFFDGPLGSRGSISNITTENLSVGTLFRAAFRNMADNYATCAARLSPERNWDRIVFSGGLAQKLPLLREFILEKLPGPSRLCSSRRIRRAHWSGFHRGSLVLRG